jgi:hypothetical protein
MWRLFAIQLATDWGYCLEQLAAEQVGSALDEMLLPVGLGEELHCILCALPHCVLGVLAGSAAWSSWQQSRWELQCSEFSFGIGAWKYI